MSQWNPSDLDDDDEDDENKDTIGHSWGLRDGLIYLIEVSEAMLDESESESSLLRTSIECCLTTLLNKIISNRNDMVGIVLYGTKNSPPPEGNCLFNPSVLPANVAVYMPMQEPNAEIIKFLQKVKDSDDMDGFLSKYGYSKDYNLADALWTCNHLFSTCGVKLQTSTIILFTQNDHPHKNDPHKAQQVMRRALDLAQLQIDIDLVALKAKFDPEPFYKELICTAMRMDPECFRMQDPALTVERLLTRICKRDHRHRCIVRVKWILGEGTALSVGIYNLCRTTLQPSKVYMERDTNQLVQSVQRYVQISPDEFGQQIEQGPVAISDRRKVQILGGEEIVFKPEEVKALKRLTEPGMKLIGFKPLSVLKLEHHVHPPSFIYPLDDWVEGSSRLFAALLDRCLSRQVLAVCVLTPKRNYPAKFVALVPQKEDLGENDLQIKPPGFHLVYLPYAENFRSLNIAPEDGPVQPTPEEVELMQQICKKLKFKYSPLNIENPKLQTLYSNIEALALDLDTPRAVSDDSRPDMDMQASLLGDLPQKFANMFGQLIKFGNWTYSMPMTVQLARKNMSLPLRSVSLCASECMAYERDRDEPNTKANKRPATDAKTNQNKVARTAAAAANVDMTEMLRKVQSGEIDKCTVKDLKDFLQAAGMVNLTGKKKAELLALAYTLK